MSSGLKSLLFILFYVLTTHFYQFPQCRESHAKNQAKNQAKMFLLNRPQGGAGGSAEGAVQGGRGQVAGGEGGRGRGQGGR